jgi:serine/threonine protein kinase
VPDILAIVSKAVFEKDARIAGKPLAIGDVWPVDRYNSTNKALASLKDGGRIFLVTVRPGDEALWLVGVVDQPRFDGTAWIAPNANAVPATNISALRKTIVFESGKGMSQEKGTLGMSLQTPRALTANDVAQLLALVAGKGPAPVPAFHDKTSASPQPKSVRVVDGKYEVLRPIGEGGMGVVYEARHTGTGRRVALKEIVGGQVPGADGKLHTDPQLVERSYSSASLRERFQREVRATGAIETAHIALVLDSGSDPPTGHPYLVMELLRGEDLKQIIARTGPLPVDVALRVVAQACVGLMRAHEAGVIHRDIKPANLFLARRDDEIVVKLLDFGIARVKDELTTPQNRALTSTGLMLGTPLYMSPEQITGSKSLDHRTDVWSLGVVLFEALTGATPHHDVETMGGLMVAICSKAARPVNEVAPHVRRSIAAIVKRALEIDPANRYSNAEALLADLKKELPAGTRLDASVVAPLEIVGVVDSAPMELADTALVTPHAVPDNATLRSADAPVGVKARPGGERRS